MISILVGPTSSHWYFLWGQSPVFYLLFTFKMPFLAKMKQEIYTPHVTSSNPPREAWIELTGAVEKRKRLLPSLPWTGVKEIAKLNWIHLYSMDSQGHNVVVCDNGTGVGILRNLNFCDPGRIRWNIYCPFFSSWNVGLQDPTFLLTFSPRSSEDLSFVRQRKLAT